MSLIKNKYIRKPLVVEAVRVTHENFADVAAWSGGKITSSDGSRVTSIDSHSQHIFLKVHNAINPRQTRGYPGDWIVSTDKGCKIYTNKAFNSVFMPDPDAEVMVAETQLELSEEVSEVTSTIEVNITDVPTTMQEGALLVAERRARQEERRQNS